MTTITMRPSPLYSSIGILGGLISPDQISRETVSPFGTLSSTHSTPEWCLSEISFGPRKDFYLLQFKQAVHTGGLLSYLGTLDKRLPVVVVVQGLTRPSEISLNVPGLPEKVVAYPGGSNSRYSPSDEDFYESDPRLDPGLVFYSEADTPTV